MAYWATISICRGGTCPQAVATLARTRAAARSAWTTPAGGRWRPRSSQRTR